MIKPVDLFGIGINSLVKRKLRTFLTLFGVVIGTASIVVLISLSKGMEEANKKMIADMGDVKSISVLNSGIGFRGKKRTLNSTAIKEIESITNVKSVIPVKRAWMRIILDRRVYARSVIGTDVEKLSEFKCKLLKGKLPKKQDELLFGFNADKFFLKPKENLDYGSMPKQNERPKYKPKLKLLSSKLIITSDPDYPKIKNLKEPKKRPIIYKAKGVGIIEYIGNYSQFDESIILEISALKQMIKEDAKILNQSGALKQLNNYDEATVLVNDMQDVEGVVKELRKKKFETHSMLDAIEPLQEQQKQMTFILGSIGAISLFVSAIGIANTMVMSIYERTSEIGVMKVIGAELDDIRNLFLVESGMIGVFGGALGVLLSYGVSWVINAFGKSGEQNFSMLPELSSSVIDVKLALFGIAFSTIIGVLAGYSPAKSAMKLSVLNALKNNA